MRRRMTYRPSKAQSVVGGVMGCLFVLIGLFVIIPQFSMAGGFAVLFGVIWTAAAAVMAATSFYRAFGKRYIGPEIRIEDEEADAGFAENSAAERLRELRDLYERSLITQEEYERKREEILREL